MAIDQELFRAALDDEHPAEQSEAQPEQSPEPELQAEQQEPAQQRERDEQGRFKAKQEAQSEPTPAATPEPEKPKEPEHRIPLAEYLSEREKRQTFEREIAEHRRQNEAFQRQIAELQRAQQPPPKTPDIFEDPQGFVGTLEQRFEQRLREQEANFSLRLAHRQYGQDFVDAYNAVVSAGNAGDRAAVLSVMQSPDPGESLMKWHRSRQLVEKTGGDLEGYLKKREDELLDNPEFMKRVAEKLKAQSGKPNSSARPAVQIPPSLSKIASESVSTEMEGGDDASLFRYALGR
jgi:hypothetical protein